jgi:hypothetical protein
VGARTQIPLPPNFLGPIGIDTENTVILRRSPQNDVAEITQWGLGILLVHWLDWWMMLGFGSIFMKNEVMITSW